MSADDFILTTTLKAKPETVYDAIATCEGIAGWWTKLVTYDNQVGSIAEMRFPKAGFWATFAVITLDRPRLIEWECIDSIHPESSGFSDLKEWNGTRVRFEIDPVSGVESRLRFTHVGLVPKLECNNTCRSIWSFYIGTSLRKLVEKGSGEPYGD